MCWTVFLVALFVSTQALAAAVPTRPNDEDEYNESVNKAWVEREIVLPAFPKTASLVELSASAAGSNRFFVDVDTLSIGADGVVRYALLVRSAGGAENVSFEGIRCYTREQKFYAFGQRNATWSPARDSQWRLIEAKEINRHHAVLFTDFFCVDGRSPPRAVREIVQRLRYPR